MIHEVVNLINDKRVFESIFEKPIPDKLLITGISGSLNSLLLYTIYSTLCKKVIFISNDKSELENFLGDLGLISPDIKTALPDEKNDNPDENSKALNLFSSGGDFIVFMRPEYLGSTVIDKSKFIDSLTILEKGKEYSFGDLANKLNDFGYSKNDFVEEQGQYSIRGGIIDIFPDSLEVPVRIEFYGDTIESLREFDIDTQRSLKDVPSVSFAMNLSNDTNNSQERTEPVFSYIPDDALIVINEPADINVKEPGIDIDNLLSARKGIFVSSFQSSNPSLTSGMIPAGTKRIKLDSFNQPDFHGNLKQLHTDLLDKLKQGYDIYMLCSDKYQAERMSKIIDDLGNDDETDYRETSQKHYTSPKRSKNLISGKLRIIEESLHSGFTINNKRIAVYTEHQVFGRYFRQLKKRKSKFKGLTFGELKELRQGDFVVHRDFGIGIYSGLKKISVSGNEQEVMLIRYKDKDKVYVNLNYIHLVKKYSSNEGHVPKLTKLGGAEWDNIKQRAKKNVKDIARDLILLYAKRKSSPGFKFSADTHWQRELEASFMYEDTPDQIKATYEIKEDMESPHPMDRLVCGDVGFGKTEVAVRAAFKAVLDNKQVAVLVPTTILAKQHFNTFRDRLSPFAVEIGVITRLEKKADQLESIRRVASGKINILIGTHRILSKDITFKDLGLLIIDEEQRFGVKAKEILRTLKPNVDTLTLTATPIPRTLNFSLLGARDLSIINTSPKNRKPIITDIITLDWEEIGRIIKDELRRNGQVYFVNDKIERMYTLAEKLKSIVPTAKISIAHGQMEARKLEDVIINFIEKKINVLVCTKIIESGLDIPNVNTIIINEAQNFGLAELYQLRGRVGRSDQQAFAYLISREGTLTRSAIRRLQSIEEFTELGSGINLAIRDMEIRGVGNLLGQQQSGFVQQMGFELFMNIIDEAVDELKTTEFSELFKDDKLFKDKISLDSSTQSKREPTIIENDLTALIPTEYIQNDTERLNIYKRLYEATSTESVDLIATELKDRFGNYLDDIENLLDLVKLRIKATNTGFEKILISGRKAFIFFPENNESEAYKSTFLDTVLNEISINKSGKFLIENDRKRLIISVELPEPDKSKLNFLLTLLE